MYIHIDIYTHIHIYIHMFLKIYTYKKDNLKSLQYKSVQTEPVIIARILLGDYWNVIGFPQLKNKREIAHIRTDT